jgi:hypothetical protein
MQTTTVDRAAFKDMLGWIAAWVWTIVAGGGGLWLLFTKGPWPLTNGWFALFSGISACPATAWVLKKYAGVTAPGLCSHGCRGVLLRSRKDCLGGRHLIRG